MIFCKDSFYNSYNTGWANRQESEPPNIGRFSKFFHCYNIQKICNAAVPNVLLCWMWSSCFIRPPETSVPVSGRAYVLPVMFFQRQISELPPPIAEKLCHMIGTWPSFILQVQKFGELPPPKKNGVKNMLKFRSILYTFRLWSPMSPERLKISKIGKICDLERFLPRSLKKVRWTLVH